MKGIIYTAAEVLALKAGLKTQTRRVIKRQPVHGEWIQQDSGGQWVYAMLKASENAIIPLKCPYSVGDRLYVKETWQPYRKHTPEQEAKINAWHAKKDYSNFMNEVDEWSPMPEGEIAYRYAADYGSWAYDVDSDMKPWKSSQVMPQAASRITIEITGVRTERLQDISETDAIAEGVEPFRGMWTQSTVKGRYWQAFWKHWDSINSKKYPWVSNPFVWVYEHKTI
jgi:hypothetical protein